MSPAGESVLVRGDGPPLLLVHGSAADTSTWAIQLESLGRSFRMIAYDRTLAGEGASGGVSASIAAQADEAAEVAATHAPGPVIACGSSFGAVIVLELLRRRPELLRGAILCEPPLPPAEYVPSAPPGLGCEFDRLVAERSGEAAAEFFLRTVFTDAGYEAMPAAFQQRVCARWRQIRADMTALASYRPRYARLRDEVAAPVLLLGGDRSPAAFRPTLEALAAAMPGAELRVLSGAGHMMHVEAHRGFARALREFAGRI